jgi:hypothetical protein
MYGFCICTYSNYSNTGRPKTGCTNTKNIKKQIFSSSSIQKAVADLLFLKKRENNLKIVTYNQDN